MKVIIVFKEDFNFAMLIIYLLCMYIPTDPLGLINIVHGLHFSSDKLIFLVGYIVYEANCTCTFKHIFMIFIAHFGCINNFKL